ncbi:MAG: hypothetical protein KKG92_02620 [Gammaproteobacteria bacterium]|nr:hypothetical protein [Gammaproteobacteria bacterium]
MSQNRDAPAYQEYAATMLAKVPFRILNMAERGFLYTLRLEMWVNQTLPAETDLLAKVLGVTNDEVATLLPAVMAFFSTNDHVIYSQELDDYRAYLESRKTRQSEGGKRGAETRKGKRKPSAKRANTGNASTLPSTPPSTLQAPYEGEGKVLVQSRTAKPSQTQPLKEGLAVDPFVTAYEAAEQAKLVRGEL